MTFSVFSQRFLFSESFFPIVSRIKLSLPGQVAHPLVAVEVPHDPGYLAHLVQAGAGKDGGRAPVEDERAEHGDGNGDAPHTYGQAVHVKERVAPAVEYPVDDDRVDAAADHVECENHHHRDKVRPRRVGQLHEGDDGLGQEQYQDGDGESDDVGDFHQPDAPELPLVQVPRAQLVADHDSGGCGHPVGGAAGQVADDGGDGVRGGGILPQVTEDGGVGRESYAPEEEGAEHGEGDLCEVARQICVMEEEPPVVRAQEAFLA